MGRLRLGVALLLPSPVAEEVDGLRRALGDRSLGRVPPHLTLVPPVNVRPADLNQALAVLRAAAAATPSRVTVALGPPTSFLPANPVVYLPVVGAGVAPGVGPDVGHVVGAGVGHVVGAGVGAGVGPVVGAGVGPVVGAGVGAGVGPGVGPVVGAGVGAGVGPGEADPVAALRRRVWEPPLTRTLTWPFVAHVTLADDAPPERIEAAVMALADYTAEVTFDRVHLLVEHRPGPQWRPLADVAFGPPAVVARGGPLAVTLVRSHQIDPEGRALLDAEGADVELDAPDPFLRGPLVVTAYREGAVVGLAAAWLTSGAGVRSSVFVAAAHRRQGIGRHLQAALTVATNDAGWASGAA